MLRALAGILALKPRGGLAWSARRRCTLDPGRLRGRAAGLAPPAFGCGPQGGCRGRGGTKVAPRPRRGGVREGGGDVRGGGERRAPAYAVVASTSSSGRDALGGLVERGGGAWGGAAPSFVPMV